MNLEPEIYKDAHVTFEFREDTKMIRVEATRSTWTLIFNFGQEGEPSLDHNARAFARILIDGAIKMEALIRMQCAAAVKKKWGHDIQFVSDGPGVRVEPG